jgi:glutamate---cysteine ligase / carboxylate-amine ligase
LHLGWEHPHVKPEMLLNTVELVMDVCTTVGEAVGQLREFGQKLRDITAPATAQFPCVPGHLRCFAVGSSTAVSSRGT